MTMPIQPASGFLRLTSGFEVLDQWSRDVSEMAKTTVYEVLFAVAERSVFTDYDVVDDVEQTMEFIVLTRSDLTVKLRVHSLDSYGIVYIGPARDAHGQATNASEASRLCGGIDEGGLGPPRLCLLIELKNLV